ncbi:BsuPI-related putative proteinase inhibitor [Natronospora cellulosivora (SeqCode)]
MTILKKKDLQFGSGQQFEIIVRDKEDQEVYRYSEGKFFTMALVFKSIEAGESLSWQYEWDMKDKDGKLVSPGKYYAEIEIITIADEDKEIADSQLKSILEFELVESKKNFYDISEENVVQEYFEGDNILLDYKLSEEGIIKDEYAKEIIENTADKVIKAIHNKDFERIAEYVHPEKGLRFTPYTYVNIERDIVFSKEEVANFFEDQNRYLWGYYDGKGNEIKLTPKEYYDEFIYSADFIDAEEIGYNEVLSSGNMLENQFDVYDKPIVVEYYFSGFDPDFDGMDWRSLRLVFEEYRGKWKLVGIIHNQWTI